MTTYLDKSFLLTLYEKVIESSGGTYGIRNESLIESAIEKPKMTFGGEELYPTLIDKVAAIGFALIANHPFTDGNKRIGHYAMDTMLHLNGYEIKSHIDEQEEFVLQIASGNITEKELVSWLEKHIHVSS